MPKKPEPLPKLPDDWPVREELVGTAVCAKLLGLKRVTVSGMCLYGTFPVRYRKIAGIYMFDLADIREYLKKTVTEVGNQGFKTQSPHGTSV
jgi:hypothetical protein